VLEFSRDRKMMSVLCSRKQQEIMFSKGAPECIISRCTHILCNDDASSVPLTTDIRNELEARFQRSDCVLFHLDMHAFYIVFTSFLQALFALLSTLVLDVLRLSLLMWLSQSAVKVFIIIAFSHQNGSG